MSLLYHEVLGIPENASIQEIKLAYRKLAKRFHPDISKEPDAQDKFILVNEAYEFLTRLKLGTDAARKGQSQKPPSDEMYKQWVRRERMKARARAAREAKRKFDEFRASPIYKTTRIIFTFYDILSLIVGFTILVAIVAGIIISSKSQEGITLNNIVAFVFMSFLGFLFIMFSVMSIRSRYSKIQSP